MPDWKRWRAWLRAIHRDIGYLAIGFTVIYAVSGIAQNHIEDWGDVSYVATERTVPIAPILETEPTAAAVARVVAAAGIGEPTSVTRAGDELRLEYPGGEKVTAIAGEVTVQTRERRAFIGVANWLHKARGKKAWKYIADFYAVFLLYLAISGIFMIKGRLGFKWRGATLIGAGVAVPVLYVALVGGPGRQKTTEPDERPAVKTATAPPKIDDSPPVLKPLPPDDDDAPAGSAALPAGSAAAPADKVVPVQLGAPAGRAAQ
ncbi:MAG TPA: PepSY-associated TM helix domain-containing protein [Kofleriaceae bacterium]|nr:PepSY-associated TM helix domain-containing protein [Kofleriaceae bacterium]